eukprot:7472314-Pyramimonas_sp.AAC.1
MSEELRCTDSSFGVPSFLKFRNLTVTSSDIRAIDVRSTWPQRSRHWSGAVCVLLAESRRARGAHISYALGTLAAQFAADSLSRLSSRSLAPHYTFGACRPRAALTRLRNLMNNTRPDRHLVVRPRPNTLHPRRPGLARRAPAERTSGRPLLVSSPRPLVYTDTS